MAQASMAAKPISVVRFNRFMAGVYLVMAAGLTITALVATWVSRNQQLLLRIATDSWFAFSLFLIQIVIVVDNKTQIFIDFEIQITVEKPTRIGKMFVERKLNKRNT